MKPADNRKPQLIIDGENAMNEILQCIREAQHTIRIRIYMWRDDTAGKTILAELREKIVSVPNIKIFIEKDALGSRVYNFQKFISLGRLGGDIFSSPIGKDFLKNMKNVQFSYVGSGSILLFKYLKENDHSKVFLFDEYTPKSTALIGGMNIADEYLTAPNHNIPEDGGWHDYMVKLKGNLSNNIASHNGKYTKKWIMKEIRKGAEILMSIGSKNIIRHEILSELSKAKKNIIIEHGYITDHAVIRKLRKMSRRGVCVKVIVPNHSDGFWHANMHSIHKLLKPAPITHQICDNIEVYLYRGMIHAKVIIIDESTAIIGSANLTYGSFDILRETNAIFRHKDGVVKELLSQIQKDLTHCEKVTLQNIPPYSHWLSWLQQIFI